MRRSLLAFAVLLTSIPVFAQYTNEQIRTIYATKAAEFGLLKADYNEAVVESQYTDQATGVTHVYIRQVFSGIPVFNRNSAMHFSKEGRLIVMHNGFQPSMSSQVNAIKPVVEPVTALQVFAQSIDKTVPQVYTKTGNAPESGVVTIRESALSSKPVHIRNYYLATEQGVKLVWNVELFDDKTGDWWNARVDALTGEFIEKNNWTVFCETPVRESGATAYSDAPIVAFTEEATHYGKTGGGQYNVYPMPLESPAFGQRELRNESSTSNGSPFGWHDTDGVAGADWTITRGNNVYASEDTLNKNIPGYSPDGGTNLVFDYPYNMRASKVQNLDAAITNLFYWNNLVHDVFYNYGFDENSGNFQANNYNKGGADHDAVMAQAQDGSGTNNANFSAPVDGQTGRMQMYLWTNSNAGNQNLKINNTTLAGNYNAPPAMFGPVITTDITADLALAIDGSTNYSACNTITNDLTGKIAVLYRSPSTCDYATKIKNAQSAGAIAVIVVNNNSFPPSAMQGSGAGIFIPSVMISKTNGDNIKNRLLAGDTVNATLIGDTNASVLYDSDMDNAVITHEYGHGISIRLTGGPQNSSCLNNSEQAGEGWSDFFALCLTAKPSDTLAAKGGRGMGTWLMYQDTAGLGIRTYKYSRNMSINPSTYNYIKSLAVPHGVGSVWCSMLYDAYWDMVDKHGFNPNFYETNVGGNNMMLQLVVDGLKYQPCNPGFVDARNAILMADSIRNGGANKLLLWKAFARRGLGGSAKQGNSSSNSDGTEGYDIPDYVLNGVAEAQAWNNVSLYPNPSKGIFTLGLPDMNGSVNIQVFDMAGKLVYEKHPALQGDSKVEVDLTNFEKGVYLISATDGQHKFQSKLMLQ